MSTASTEPTAKEVSGTDSEMEDMLQAGVHIGHSRSRRHPAMAPYLWGVRSNVSIIDLAKTKEKLAAALAFLRSSAAEGKLFLFVGTRPSAADLVRRTAESLSMPYVTQRWIGGTLTNFKVILKRVETWESLLEEQASGGFEKYTKKERMKKEEEMAHLAAAFGGLHRLRKLPDGVVIIGLTHEALAAREATRMRIPIVALTDTDSDPRQATYPIPANDDARPAVTYLLERIRVAVAEGLGEAEQRSRETASVEKEGKGESSGND